MSVVDLWLPIIVSAALVFTASFVIHMVVPWHRADFDRLPDEEVLRAALRPVDPPPGWYVVPWAGSASAMKTEAFQAKRVEGPNLFLAVMPKGPPSMGPQLVQWFVFCLVVSVFAAYVTSRAAPVAGGAYLDHFRFAGTTAFAAYALALWQDSIFFGRKWTASLTFTLDGLIYGLLTGGVFGWLAA